MDPNAALATVLAWATMYSADGEDEAARTVARRITSAMIERAEKKISWGEVVKRVCSVANYRWACSESAWEVADNDAESLRGLCEWHYVDGFLPKEIA